MNSNDPYKIAYGKDYVDVTDDVVCYEHGKVFDCECGQDIGVYHEIEAVVCASCSRYCVDKHYRKRDAPSNETQQSTLGEW